ncbi:MAG TPA: hypothetical protein DHV36_12800 [Desulfobacteraceae bacterium]|nr:hypothetical protein [Desulfobacteraceae bacterium]
MRIRIKQPLLFLFTCICFGMIVTAHANADSLTTRPATQADIKQFYSELSKLSQPIYLVHLLYRECYKIEGEFSFRKIESKTGASYYLGYKPDKNLLITDATPNKSKETIKGAVTSSQLSDCPKVNTYEQMKRVYVKGGKTVGWVFETAEPYCLLPVYLFPQGDRGCVYAYCKLTCHANTETKLFTLDKKFAESIRESLKPNKQIDKLDPHEKRSCDALD